MSEKPPPYEAQQPAPVHLMSTRSSVRTTTPSSEFLPADEQLSTEARDELLQKLTVRVARIDQEVELLVQAAQDQGSYNRAVRHDITQLSADVREIGTQVQAIKDLLVQVLANAPDPDAG